MKKGGLGRGLSALIPDAGATSSVPDVEQADSTTSVASEYATDTSPDKATAAPESEVTGVADDVHLELVAISAIEPNRYQPRRVFDDEKMAELTLSIQEIGVLQPIRASYRGWIRTGGRRASLEGGSASRVVSHPRAGPRYG